LINGKYGGNSDKYAHQFLFHTGGIGDDPGKQDGSGKSSVATVNNVNSKIFRGKISSGHRGPGAKDVQNLGGTKSHEASKRLNHFLGEKTVSEQDEKHNNRQPKEDINFQKRPRYFLQAELCAQAFFFPGRLSFFRFIFPAHFQLPSVLSVSSVDRFSLRRSTDGRRRTSYHPLTELYHLFRCSSTIKISKRSACAFALLF
jgi:hypothetical protein